MKVYTKKGDTGETGLLFGGRVSKADARVETYGAIDSAVSAMGLARALCADPWVKDVLLRVQRKMFVVGAELATDPAQYHHLEKHFSAVTADMTTGLEAYIDEADSQMDMPRAFIVPGASAGSAALDVARTLARTAERRVVDLGRQGRLKNPEVLTYLNRLSDLLFMLARFEDRALPVELSTGEPRDKAETEGVTGG